MKKKDNIIGGKCEIFACRICRTKYGYKHQIWCELSHITLPQCEHCRYWSADGDVCKHPLKKVGAKD